MNKPPEMFNNGLLFDGFSDALLITAAIACISFMMMGIPGNFITVLALLRFKKKHSATTIFITNLAISDLLFCCINLPLAASVFWYRKWIFTESLCLVFPLLRYGLVAVSLLSILAISLNRYLMIVHPNFYNQRINTKCKLALMVVFTWCFAFGILMPTLFGRWGHFGLDRHIGSCSILPDANGNSPKIFLFLTAFLLPCVCITVCYIRIYFAVLKASSIIRATSKPELYQSQLNVNQKVTKNIDKYLVTCAQNKCQLVSFNCQSLYSVRNTNTNENFRNNNGSLKLPKKKYWDVNDSENNVTKFSQDGGNDDKCYVRNLDEKSRQNVELKDSQNNTKVPFNEGNKSKINEIDSSNYIQTKNLNLKEKSYSTDFLIDTNTTSVSDVVSKSTDFDVMHPSDNIIANENSNSTSNHQKNSKKALSRHNSAPFIHSVNRHPSQSLHKSESKRVSNKDRKVFKMILVIFVAFFICYTPITISKIVHIDSEVFFILSYLCIYLAPCINPLIYVVMSTEYRQAYRSLICCSTSNLALSRSS